VDAQPSQDQSLIANNSLNLLTWNIQSSNNIEGNKFEDVKFANIFNKYDIVCLQETRQDVKLSGFRSRCSIRKGQKSGGVCILFKNKFIGGIEEVLKKSKNSSDIIICKLKRSFFKFKRDIFYYKYIYFT
jgi:exonuclease III